MCVYEESFVRSITAIVSLVFYKTKTATSQMNTLGYSKTEQERPLTREIRVDRNVPKPVLPKDWTDATKTIATNDAVRNGGKK